MAGVLKVRLFRNNYYLLNLFKKDISTFFLEGCHAIVKKTRYR